MSRTMWARLLAALAALVLVAAACGSEDDSAAGSADGPTIVVTTNILGDVVGELVGDQAQVITIMPVGADPHDFQASAAEVDQLLQADALIINGAAFEEGLLDVIDSAMDEGVPTHEAIETVSTIEFGEGGHDEHGHDEHGDEHDEDKEHSDEGHSDEEHSDEEHSDEEHSDEEHSDEEHSDEEHSDEDKEHSEDEHDEHGHDEHGHDHDGADPHFFTDPVRMADAVQGIADFLEAEVEGLDTGALDTATDDYLKALAELDAEVDGLIDDIPAEQRILVTNHEVFGYFADRYGFEVVGAVIPTGSTADGASAGELAELAELIEAEGVPAIFADTSASTELAETLAAEVGEVDVVELYTESLGQAGSDGATYLDMVRTNASRISAALA